MMLFDTSVIIDARDERSPWHKWAQERIADAVAADGAGANTIVISEASVRAEKPEEVPTSLEAIGMTLLPLPTAAAIPAAKAFASIWTGSEARVRKRKTECRFPIS